MKKYVHDKDIIFTIDDNSDHFEKFSILVEYIRNHKKINELSYIPLVWNQAHFHFTLNNILFRLDFNDVLGTDIKLDKDISKQQLKEAKLFIKELYHIVN
jgi:hypothetical protein